MGSWNLDGHGVLHIRPSKQDEVERLKDFIREYAEHGSRMIEIETELDPEYYEHQQQHQYSGSSQYGNPLTMLMARYGYYENPFGFARRDYDGFYEDYPPFSPRMEYDNNYNNNGYERNRRGQDEDNGRNYPPEIDGRRGGNRGRGRSSNR